ncbi:MAG: DUF1501 domain-containing protein [Lentisphaeraceae bacterium]|nr:DUF1501 domain-containing protein [Lentisphaeraceae bacterium]
MNTDQPVKEYIKLQTRRQFFRSGAAGLGGAALASMLTNADANDKTARNTAVSNGVLGNGHFKAKAKRVIYLFMAGAPSQLDTFDYKPKMKDFFNKDLPESVRKGQRLTTMTAAQARFPIAPSMFEFKQHGQCGRWVSELLPNMAKMTDDISFVHSMWTEAINHDPAITYIQTGNQIPGRPSLGSWLSYGLGSMNRNLPEFIVLNCAPRGQALYSRLWGSGFLPSKHSGVAFRSQGDPVLYLSNPGGMSHDLRRTMLDTLQKANKRLHEKYNNPETDARISQYEMAFRMQASVPDLVDISKEPESVKKMYGPDVEKPGTFAYNCLLARRMAEKDVRFTQIFHRGWDHHTGLPKNIRRQTKEVDQPAWALIQDLKQRGLLEDTLVVWGGEFGRTIYSQGTLTKDNYGRDHHPRCFTIWMAGGGIKGGLSHGVTDEFGYNVVQDPVHIRDLNATIMHNMGIDHERFSVKYLGLDQRLTGVEPARIIKNLLV